MQAAARYERRPHHAGTILDAICSSFGIDDGTIKIVIIACTSFALRTACVYRSEGGKIDLTGM